jgi:DNA-binding NarL/FixJ family response regulator
LAPTPTSPGPSTLARPVTCSRTHPESSCSPRSARPREANRCCRPRWPPGCWAACAPAEEALSPRELEILGARGLSNKDIGQQLRVSEATVKTHLLRIFGKLAVDDHTAAVTVALERGIIRLPG